MFVISMVITIMEKLQINKSHVDSYLYELNPKSHISIGRSSSSHIQLLYNFVSRAHCYLVLMEKDTPINPFYWVIKDNNSSNGVWLNNTQIKVEPLVNNDVITFNKDINYPNIKFLDSSTVASDTDNKSTGAHEYEKE
jgi:pSer/pThr/pTyr-binding forkhead associated (FHA) protein